jgi:hypothetical protein
MWESIRILEVVHALPLELPVGAVRWSELELVPV